MKTEWREIPVEDGTKMRVYRGHPDGPRPTPAVIVLQEIFGVNSHIRDVCHRLTELGYRTIAPELFHRTAPPGFEAGYTDYAACRPHSEALTAETMLLDFKATYRHLTEDSGVRIDETAAIGFCLGGRAAYLANSVLPLRGAISFYGSRINTMLERATTQKGSLLFFWGGKDAHIDLAQKDQVRQALREAKKDFADVEFSAADHGFFCDQRPAYHPPSARQAWALTTQFLQDCFATEKSKERK